MEHLDPSTPLDHILLIFDVDGVIREGVEAKADPQVLSLIKMLLDTPYDIHICFLSGTPVEADLTLETWRRGNLPLSFVFGDTFDAELSQGTVSVYGMLGGQKMQAGSTSKTLESYPLSTSFELGRWVTEACVKEFLLEGSQEQRDLALSLLDSLRSLRLLNTHQPQDATAIEFAPYAETIRAALDPDFRLISNGATVETHVSSSCYNSSRAFHALKNTLLPLPPHDQPYLSHGLAKRGAQDFHFLLLSKSNKGIATRRIIQERQRVTSPPLVITVGDTQLDFLMHQQAHLAFHVGLEEVWQAHPLSHCVLIRGPQGKDRQHVKGTLSILKLLHNTLGRPARDLWQLFRKTPAGLRDYNSPL